MGSTGVLQDDVNNLADVANSTRGISTLHEATGGDPTISPRWRRHLAYGAEQEVIAGLRMRSGEVWGAASMYRQTGSPMFDSDIKDEAVPR